MLDKMEDERVCSIVMYDYNEESGTFGRAGTYEECDACFGFFLTKQDMFALSAEIHHLALQMKDD